MFCLSKTSACGEYSLYLFSRVECLGSSSLARTASGEAKPTSRAVNPPPAASVKTSASRRRVPEEGSKGLALQRARKGAASRVHATPSRVRTASTESPASKTGPLFGESAHSHAWSCSAGVMSSTRRRAAPRASNSDRNASKRPASRVRTMRCCTCSGRGMRMCVCSSSPSLDIGGRSDVLHHGAHHV